MKREYEARGKGEDVSGPKRKRKQYERQWKRMVEKREERRGMYEREGKLGGKEVRGEGDKGRKRRKGGRWTGEERV